MSTHSKEVEAGYRAWVEGVRQGKGLIELVGDIVRAVDEHRAQVQRLKSK